MGESVVIVYVNVFVVLTKLTMMTINLGDND